MTFFDMYEFFDQEPVDGEYKAGFKQQWEASPFFESYEILPESEVSNCYYRLLAKYFSTPFGMLDERQINLNVFKIMKDYLPNLINRIATYNEIYNQDIQNLMTKQSRVNQNQSSGTGSISDKGFENQATAPNTQGSTEAPILDMISAQRNKDFLQGTSDSRNATTTEEVRGDLATAYNTKLSAIVDGLWDEFINRFGKLFVTLYSGVYDYVYRNKIEDNEEEEE